MTAKAAHKEEEVNHEAKQEVKHEPKQPDLSEVLGSIVQQLDKLDSRLAKIEDGGKNEFKKHATAEDVEKASEGRQGVDPRIIKIVDEMLGEDFQIRLDTHKDGRLGMLFTLVVPTRLSDLPEQLRPLKGPDGNYLTNKDGGFQMESYKPEDLRSKAISSEANVDVIREHCERVRSHIVAYYQKMQKPLPEFKIKSY